MRVLILNIRCKIIRHCICVHIYFFYAYLTLNSVWLVFSIINWRTVIISIFFLYRNNAGTDFWATLHTLRISIRRAPTVVLCTVCVLAHARVPITYVYTCVYVGTFERRILIKTCVYFVRLVITCIYVPRGMSANTAENLYTIDTSFSGEIYAIFFSRIVEITLRAHVHA